MLEQNNNLLETLLQEELSCFKEILFQTQTLQNGMNTQVTETVLELLEERELRINLINRLENERLKLELCTNEFQPVIETIKGDIKDIALNLVRIDAELMDILAAKKEEIAKELKYSSKVINAGHLISKDKSRFIDVRQK